MSSAVTRPAVQSAVNTHAGPHAFRPGSALSTSLMTTSNPASGVGTPQQPCLDVEHGSVQSLLPGVDGIALPGVYALPPPADATGRSTVPARVNGNSETPDALAWSASKVPVSPSAGAHPPPVLPPPAPPGGADRSTPIFGQSVTHSIGGSRPMTPNNHMDATYRSTPSVFGGSSTGARPYVQPQASSQQSRSPVSSANLLVTDLPPRCKHSDLRRLFEAYGNVVSVNVKVDPRGRQPPKGFVLLSDPAEAAQARAGLHQSSLLGARISVFSAQQTSGAVPRRCVFVRFIPSAVDHDTIVAFFSYFGNVISVRVRPQRAADAPPGSCATAGSEFNEAVIDYGQPVPEPTREAIADCDMIVNPRSNATFQLPQPLVVKYDEPERDRVIRNQEVGANRSSSRNSNCAPQPASPYGSAPASPSGSSYHASPHQAGVEAYGGQPVLVPLQTYAQAVGVGPGGLLALPHGAGLMKVNGQDYVQLPPSQLPASLQSQLGLGSAAQPTHHYQQQQPQNQFALSPSAFQPQQQHAAAHTAGTWLPQQH